MHEREVRRERGRESRGRRIEDYVPHDNYATYMYIIL